MEAATGEDLSAVVDDTLVYSPGRALDAAAFPSAGAGMVGTAPEMLSFLMNSQAELDACATRRDLQLRHPLGVGCHRGRGLRLRPKYLTCDNHALCSASGSRISVAVRLLPHTRKCKDSADIRQPGQEAPQAR
jgi:hypothetical protein